MKVTEMITHTIEDFPVVQADIEVEKLKEELYWVKVKLIPEFAKEEYDKEINRIYNKYIGTEEWFNAYNILVKENVDIIFKFGSSFIGNQDVTERIVKLLYSDEYKDSKIVKYYNKDIKFHPPIEVDIAKIPHGMSLDKWVYNAKNHGLFIIDSQKR